MYAYRQGWVIGRTQRVSNRELRTIEARDVELKGDCRGVKGGTVSTWPGRYFCGSGQRLRRCGCPAAREVFSGSDAVLAQMGGDCHVRRSTEAGEVFGACGAGPGASEW